MFRFPVYFLLVLILATGQVTAQELTLYTFPPPRDLNWKSPQSLAFCAAVGNRLVVTHLKHKHTFGHVFIELKGDGYHELTGSTTAPDAPADAEMITKHGHGLGVFFAPLKDQRWFGGKWGISVNLTSHCQFVCCLDPTDNPQKLPPAHDLFRRGSSWRSLQPGCSGHERSDRRKRLSGRTRALARRGANFQGREPRHTCARQPW